jgi:hypothetical protein
MYMTHTKSDLDILHQVLSDFRLPMRYYHLSFSLVAIFHTYSLQKSQQKQCSLIIFPLSYTLWVFTNLIFRIFLLSSCPSQSHIADLGHILILVWVLHLDIKSFCITSSHLVRNYLCPVWYFDHISHIQTWILIGFLCYYTFWKVYEVFYNFRIHKLFRKNCFVVIIVIDQICSPIRIF